MAIFCFYSNRAEELFSHLKTKLFAPGIHPFHPRLILSPSPLMKMWLMQRFADDLGVAAGIEIDFVEEGLKKVEKRLTGFSSSFPSSFELSFLIENEIENILKFESDLPIWKPLIHFLGQSKKKQQKRKTALSKELARLFVQYDRFAKKAFEEPEKLGWQGVLWSRVIVPNQAEREFKKSPLSLTLFAVSFLSNRQFEFLEKASQTIEITLYHLSPCQMYWGDVLSDREARNYEAGCKRRHVKEASLLELEEYLRDRNPMLANFGRLGRQMAVALEEKTVNLGESYVVSASIAENSHWSPFCSEEILLEQAPLTKLTAIQADLLFLRNPEDQSDLVLSDDLSLQVHAASSSFRQVEILKDLILERVDKGTPFCDIVVMAPEIGEFTPYIGPIFEQAKIPIQVMEVQSPKDHGLIQAFIHLIDLPFSRFTSNAILELIEYVEFQKKMGWEAEQVAIIREWVKKTSVFWGYDVKHRDAILSHECDGAKMVERSQSGSWRQGFYRLLHSFAAKEEFSIDQTKGKLLGEFVHFFHSLMEDLKPLADGVKMELSEWRLYLEALSDTYLEGDKELLLIHLNKLNINGIKSDFHSVANHIKESLSKERVNYRQNKLNCVRFCSLLPMRAIPAQVIFLLGMDEGAFPKQEKKLSINLLTTLPQVDWAPSQTDYDRTLFLEVLLSARKRLYLLYNSISESDGKLQAPSIVVKELISYFERFYGGCFQLQHPSFAFDKVYFSKDGLFFSYSQEAFRQAKAYYVQKKKPKFRPLSHFLPPCENFTETEELTISIKELNLCVKDPLKLYFQEALDFWIKERIDQGIKEEEPFQLDPLKAAILKRQGVTKPLEPLVEDARKKGDFPFGLFSDCAATKLSCEITKLNQSLKSLKLKPEDLYCIALTDEPVDEEGVIVLPPLKLGRYSIVGRLDPVSHQGLVSWGEGNKVELVKMWPNFLVFQAVVAKYGLCCLPNLLFLKNAIVKEQSFESKHLEQLIDYCQLVKRQASPLLPEWILDLIEKDEQHMHKKIKTSLKSDHFYHNAFKWALQNGEIPEIGDWKKIADMVFSPIRGWK